MKGHTLIDGVEIKENIIHDDDRGFFTEILRCTDSIFGDRVAQCSHSMSKGGVVKAWHLHFKQTDWMYVASGDIKLALYDKRQDSSTYKALLEIPMGESKGRKVVKIPPGVAHGYKVLNGPMHIIYIMNREYDPSDEIRIPHDDPEINYNWHANEI
jgi:dTDP-4-dehydrorhamnose 3,5-epimerase